MEPFLICLPVIRAEVVATAVPLSATKSASIATAIAGDMRPSTFRKTDPPSVGVSHPSLRKRPDRATTDGLVRSCADCDARPDRVEPQQKTARWKFPSVISPASVRVAT